MSMLMKTFRGAPALSDFRVNKLLNQCAELQLPVTDIYAEFSHFAHISEDLSTEESQVLQQLLKYGPTIEEHEPVGNFY